jgi:hypothetical protein
MNDNQSGITEMSGPQTTGKPAQLIVKKTASAGNVKGSPIAFRVNKEKRSRIDTFNSYFDKVLGNGSSL